MVLCLLHAKGAVFVFDDVPDNFVDDHFNNQYNIEFSIQFTEVGPFQAITGFFLMIGR